MPFKLAAKTVAKVGASRTRSQSVTIRIDLHGGIMGSVSLVTGESEWVERNCIDVDRWR